MKSIVLPCGCVFSKGLYGETEETLYINICQQHLDNDLIKVYIETIYQVIMDNTKNE